MPTITTDDGCPIHLELEGPATAPVLMLSNSLGATTQMWDDQVKSFTQHFRLLRYDRRGHGKSGVPKGPYTMERLGRDVVAILDGLKIDKVNWCGLSMGGMVGMWVAANAPQRVDRVVLSNTSAYYEVKTGWDDRIKAVRAGGLASIAPMVANAWFTKGFQEREPEKTAQMIDMMKATPVDGYIACCEAVRDMDHREVITRIAAPTLVIAGQHDMGTPVSAAEYIRSRIPGAKLTVLDAAHIANVEQPVAYAEAVLGFLTHH